MKKYFTETGTEIKKPEAYAKTGAPMYLRGDSKNINEETVIYKLNLEDVKKYIGKTTDVERRMEQHFSGNGSKVTQKFKPKNGEVIDIVPGYFSNEVEQDRTVKYIKKYGYSNVRGGYYTKSTTLEKSTDCAEYFY